MFRYPLLPLLPLRVKTLYEDHKPTRRIAMKKTTGYVQTTIYW